MTGFKSKKAAAQDKLAQPAQEPVGVVQHKLTATFGADYEQVAVFCRALDAGTHLYTTPPQRPWVDLTDNQIEQIYYDLVKIHRGAPMPWGQINFGKVLQAAIREANK